MPGLRVVLKQVNKDYRRELDFLIATQTREGYSIGNFLSEYNDRGKLGKDIYLSLRCVVMPIS